MQREKLLVATCTIAALSVTEAVPVLAQDPDAGSEVLQEVVVTAEHRSQSLEKTALAISALDTTALAQAGVTQTADLGNAVPGLQIAQAGPNTQVYLRGVGTLATNSYAEPAIAINQDGVYIARTDAMDNMFYDLQRVEVLKGPQGTLYGRNSVGGAINVITQKPTADFGGFLTVEDGNYSRVLTSGAINLPVADQLRVRAAFQTVKHSGYLSDGYNDQDTQAGRIHVLYLPTDSVSLLVSGDYSHSGGRGAGGVLAPFVDSQDSWVGPTDPRTSAVRAALNNRAAFKPNVVNPYSGTGLPPVPDIGHQDIGTWGTSADLEWDLSFATLSAIGAYRRPVVDYTTLATQYPIYVHEVSPQHSGEIRLASNGETRLKWLGGLYYFHEQEDVVQDTNQFTNYSTQSYTLKTRSMAAFEQSTLTVVDGFRLTLGLRYTAEKKSLEGSRGTAKPVAPPPTCPAGSTYTRGEFPVCLYPIYGDLDFHSTNYKAGFEYDLARESMLYFNVSTGYKAGGFYAGLPPNTFKPEKLTAYALGLKSRFWNDRLQINTEAYYWDYRDHQESFFGPIQPSGFGFITGNVGKQTMKGLDVDLQWSVTGDDLLSLKPLYLDSRYDDLRYATSSLSTTTCAATGQTSGAFPIIDCRGRQLIRAPRWSVNADYQHTFHLPGAATLTAHAGIHYQTATSVSLNFDPPADFQGAYHMSNVDFTLRPASEAWSITAWARNLENKAVIVSANFPPGTSATTSGGPVYAADILQAPRTYGVTATVHF
jgi:iron complex outermembrane receptor protein